MKSSASKIKMNSFNDLFKTDNEVCDAYSDSEKIQQIPIEQLFAFHDHPFKVLDDEKMEETQESVAKYGVLVPAIARPRDGGGYELVAGHRRKKACELLGIPTLPVIIRKLDDDEATIIMVDSNIQRENLLFSEKAFAYKMKLQAIKRKAGRPTNNSTQLGQNFPKGKFSVEILAKQAGESRNQIQRYIRLTELIPKVLGMVDDRKIAFNTAGELSYLKVEEQQLVLDKMTELEVIPSMAQATRLKEDSSKHSLTATDIDAVLTKGNKKSVQVTLKGEKLKKYFPKTYSQQQIEEVITELLEQWHLENTEA